MNTRIEQAFLELVNEGWANGSAGALDAPTGLVTIIDMSTERAMMAQVLAETDDLNPGETIQAIEPGWYVITQEPDGTVDISKPLAQAQAEAILRDIKKSEAR